MPNGLLQMSEQNTKSHSVYKMGKSFNLTSEQQMVITVLSTAGKMKGEILRQVGCSVCCEQVYARQVIWTQEVWPQTCCPVGRLEAGKTGALGPISELRGDCSTVEWWWCACITINNLSQNKGNGLHQPYTMGEVSWILSSARSGWLGPRRSGTGQLDSGLELSSLMSRSSAFRLEIEDHEFGGSPTKLISPAA